MIALVVEDSRTIRMVVAGIAMLAGRNVSLGLGEPFQPGPGRGGRQMVVFGAAYATASLSCTLAVLLASGIALAAGGGSDGAAWVLRVGTVIYLAATALSFRVPARVDVPRPQEADPVAPATGRGSVPTRNCRTSTSMSRP